MSDTPGPRELLDVAADAARRAGRLLAERFTQPRTIELKGGIDMVTDADRASERELLGLIRARFPDHAVLAEESGHVAGGGTRWIIDPLDGTTNYVHQIPHFCVSVGVEDEGGLLAGAVYDPIRDELFTAARGQGAALNGRPLRASPTAELSRALLCTGFPYDVRERPELPLGLVARFVRRAQGIRRMGSAALDLAYVAAGRYDGFFEFGLKAWDVAAGALLVEEAGGAVSGIDGSPLSLTAGHVLATNTPLSGLMRAECAAFLADLGWKPG